MRVVFGSRIGLVAVLLMLSGLAGACASSPGQPANATAQVKPLEAASPVVSGPATAATQPARPQPTSTPVTGPTAVAKGGAAAKPPAKALFLQVDSPAEDDSVDSSRLQVSGSTIPGAVVSVDGDLVKVKSDGTFSTEIKLDEGPNDVEVVASDRDGNEQSVIRSVIYEP